MNNFDRKERPLKISFWFNISYEICIHLLKENSHVVWSGSSFSSRFFSISYIQLENDHTTKNHQRHTNKCNNNHPTANGQWTQTNPTGEEEEKGALIQCWGETAAIQDLEKHGRCYVEYTLGINPCLVYKWRKNKDKLSQAIKQKCGKRKKIESRCENKIQWKHGKWNYNKDQQSERCHDPSEWTDGENWLWEREQNAPLKFRRKNKWFVGICFWSIEGNANEWV